MKKIILITLLLAGTGTAQTTSVVPFRPGGMFSDIIESEMSAMQWQTVTNLHLYRSGEWIAVDPVDSLFAVSMDNALEVRHESDRFYLFQNDTSIKTLDPLTGNIETYTTPDSSSLTDTRYMHQTNTGVRIYGADDPMWFGYKDVVNFDYTAYPDTLKGWYLLPSSVRGSEIDIEYNIATPSWDSFELTFLKTYDIRPFVFFDDNSFSMPDSSVGYESMFSRWFTNITLEYPDNPRVTGWGLISTRIDTSVFTDTTYKVIYYTPDLDVPDPFRFIQDADHYSLSASYPKNLYVSSGRNWDDNLITQGDTVMIKNTYTILGSSMFATGIVDTVVFGSLLSDAVVYTFVDSITNQFTTLGDQPATEIIVYQNITSPTATSISYNIDLDIENGIGYDFFDFTGIPAGEDDITPDYDAYTIAGGLAFCHSTDKDESDFLRYSPPLQFDVFPEQNQISINPSGIDTLVALAAMDNDLVIFKDNSVELGMVGVNGYRMATRHERTGLLNPLAWQKAGPDIYFASKYNFYRLHNGALFPLAQSTGIRRYYEAHVTDSSRVMYSQQDNEILVTLDSGMLCYQIEFGTWYLRNDVQPIGGFLDHNYRLLWYDDTKLNTWDGSTAVNSITWNATGRILLHDWFEHMRISQAVISSMSGNSISLSISDPNETRTYTESITPDTSRVGLQLVYPKYMFREASASISGTGDATVRGFQLKVERTR